jgi:hypothetical protein
MERVMAVNFLSRRERNWFVISEPGVSTPCTINTRLYCDVPDGSELSMLTFVVVEVGMEGESLARVLTISVVAVAVVRFNDREESLTTEE